jgi:hypothetical protein
MIPYGLFSQILFLLLSIALIFTYIKPTLAEIDTTQDAIETYVVEIDKVSSVNAKLANLMSSYSSISQADRLRLLSYMPDEVDTIAVPRDLFAIATQAGVIIRQIEYGGSLNGVGSEITSDLAAFDPAAVPVVSTSNEPEKHQFNISFEGSYAQVKMVLALMEENAYPLEVQELDITKSEGGFLTVAMDITTYDSTLPVSSEAAIQ